MNNKDYFDQNYLLKPHGENGILFTSEYILLKKMLKHPVSVYSAITAIESQIQDDGTLLATSTDKWSHDNHTGLVSLSYNLGLNYHKKMYWKQPHHMLHPVNFIYYMILRGGISGFLMRIFTPILTIAMIWTCISMYKYRTINGKRIKILKTDGKLIAWLRINTLKMSFTNRICSAIIKRRFGSWYEVFRIYFRNDENHPCIKLSKKLYGGHYE